MKFTKLLNFWKNLQALGNLYFIHENIQSVRIWNFHTHAWEWTENKIIFCGNIEGISIKDKAKFPRHFFPEVSAAVCSPIHLLNFPFLLSWYALKQNG